VRLPRGMRHVCEMSYENVIVGLVHPIYAWTDRTCGAYAARSSSVGAVKPLSTDGAGRVRKTYRHKMYTICALMNPPEAWSVRCLNLIRRLSTYLIGSGSTEGDGTGSVGRPDGLATKF